MTERTIRVHVFASVKGGVGKSSLAITCAKLLARKKNRLPVLVDCDMTGTSFADGLHLCAPQVATDDKGEIDFLQPPTGEFCTHAETVERRVTRRDIPRRQGAPLPNNPPPYLNDVLRYLRTGIGSNEVIDEPRVDALLWRHEQEDGVLYLPSSPLAVDVAEGLEWFPVRPSTFDWLQCLTWVLYLLAEQRQDLTDVVIDLPPGVVGLTHEIMVMLSALEKGTKFPEWYPPWNDGKIRWTANPILVLTLDQNDLRPALEYVVRTAHHLDTLLPLVNRCGSIEEAREEARKVSTVLLGGLRVEDKLVNIDEHRATLGRILREGNLLVTNDILKLERVLRIEEA